MERRYDLFQHSSTRNIEGYNQFIRRQNEELDEKQSELPYIVVIVDELADLMMVAGKKLKMQYSVLHKWPVQRVYI